MLLYIMQRIYLYCAKNLLEVKVIMESLRVWCFVNSSRS